MDIKSPNSDPAPCEFGDIEKLNEKMHKDYEMMNNNEMIKLIQNLNLNEKPKKKGILKPRDYQQKIFDKAKEQNSIIYVETGKGKTFISIMLMANHLGIDISNPSSNKKNIDKNKKIIFFVCDTALIEQQKKAIEDILGIEAGKIQGKKNKKNKSDYEFFRKMWDSLNVFVAIPSIIYKLLSCGFLKIFEISMLIFDECHHAGDDHPYNKIMEEFYFFYKRLKPNHNLNYPRIYGLTASPMKKGIKGPVEASIIKAMEQLCENLDSVIIIDPEMNNSNAKLMKKGETIENYLKDDSYIEVKSHFEMPDFKKVIVAVYNNCFMEMIAIAFENIAKFYPEYSNSQITKKYSDYVINRFKSHNLEEYNLATEKSIDMYNLRNLSIIMLIFEKIQRQIFMILENLGLNSLILYFSNLIDIYDKLYSQKLVEEENNSNNLNIKDNSNQLNISDDNDNDEEIENDLCHLSSSLILDIRNAFINTKNSLIDLKERSGNNYISDRLNKLYSKIDELFNKNDQSKFIIFIANRIVAHFLHPELNRYLKSKEKYKNKACKEIIGINKRKSNGGTTLTPSLTLKQMNDIIRQFNEDQFNILIGTSAIEEGLDIQSCNAVLALVELRTPKRFIQIKGRARKSNSEFIIFTNSASQGKLKIKEFLKIGQKINELFKDDIKKDFKRNNFISLKKDFKFSFDKRSHSKLTMSNASIFFNEIIQQIKAKGIKFDVDIKIKKVKSSNKTSEFQFDGTINLTTDLHEIESEFPMTEKNSNSKENAQKMCQFYLLIILKKHGYLDEHLKFQII